MIEAILPSAVAAAEAYCDPPEAALAPEEEAVVARAVPARRSAFTTGRACARRALTALGMPPLPIPSGERGAPEWPAGVVGSITHCDGYRAAVVARAGDVAAIGIDAEPDAPLPPRVLGGIALAEELAWVRELGSRDARVAWDRLLFCAKEAVYKAWFPLARRPLGFADAAIHVDPVRRTFGARLLVRGPVAGGRRLTGFEGRWHAGRGLLVTAIALTAREGDG